MKKLIKSIFIGIVIIIGLMALLITSAHLYLQTDHAQKFIQAKINEIIPGTITWETYQFSAIKCYFELRNVVLNDVSHEAIAGIEKLSVRISRLSFFKGELVFTLLILENPWAAIRVDNEGRVNLLQTISKGQSGQKKSSVSSNSNGLHALPINIIVKKFSCVNGSVHFDMDSQKINAVLEHIEIKADANLDEQSGNFSIETGKWHVKSKQFQTELNQFTLQAAIKEGRIEPLLLRANNRHSQLRLSGTILEAFTRPALDLDLNLMISLAEARKDFNLSTNLSGQVVARITALGSINNPELKIDLQYGGGFISKYLLKRTDLECQLKDRILTINQARAVLDSGHISLQGKANLKKAFSQGFLGSVRDLDAITYQASLDLQGIKLEKMIVENQNIRGNLESKLNIVGKGISPKTLAVKSDLSVILRHLKTTFIKKPVDLHIYSEARINQGIADVSLFEAGIGKNTLAAHGSYDLSSQALSAAFKVYSPAPGDFLPDFSPQDVRGTLEMEASISGSLQAPVFSAIITGEKFGLRDINLGTIELHANLDKNGIMNIPRFVIANQGSFIRGLGSIKLFNDDWRPDRVFPINLSAQFQNVKPNVFIENIFTSGTLDGNMQINGSLESLQAFLSLQGINLATKDVRIGDISIEMQLRDGMLSMINTNIRNRKSRLDVSGSVQLFEKNALKVLNDPLVSIDLKGDSLFLEDFLDVFSGKFSLGAHVTGKLKNPQGVITLVGTDLDLGFQKIAGLTLNSYLKETKLLLDNFQISMAPDEEISCAGWLSFQKTFQVSIISNEISLHHIDKIRDQGVAEGNFLLDFSGKGSLENPQVNGTVLLNNLRIKGKEFSDTRIQVELHDKIARIWGKLNFVFEGLYNLSSNEFSANAYFDQTVLSPYFKLAKLPDLDGKMSGKIELSGNKQDLETTSASIDISSLRLFSQEMDLIRTEDVSISLKNKAFSALPFDLVILDSGIVNISGSGEIGGQLSLKANGNIPLQIFGYFIKDISDITGNLFVTANIAGTLEAPDVQANIKLDKAGLTLPYTQQKLHNMSGPIHITSHVIDIDQLKGQIDTGRFSLAGKIFLKDFKPAEIQIALNADTIPVKIPDTLDMLLNTDLKMQGTQNKSSITGQIVIIEGTYYKDVDLSLLQSVVKRKREVPLPRQTTRVPFLKNMSIDIALKRRYPFVIDNNLAQMDISPDLSIAGKFNQPLISGRAKVESGTITYRNKTFTITRGIIDFLNPYKIEPVIDIMSEVRIRNWLVYLAASGTPDQLAFKLSSDPVEESEDILSLVLFGKTTRELIKADGGVSLSASQMLTELIANAFSEDIKRTTGLDILEVEQGSDENNTTSDRIKVTIGKDLSRRLSVKYAMESKNSEMIQRAIAEYKLYENLMISGFEDSSGIFGAEIQYRLEFR
ncbi:MAG: translocation/assembly module TamB domain-containing protein [Deltaproteobacteria bacterium]|nr:translocation/assembly module TamB domain-containing protein [Deltaproteobacteria bacterium]